MRQGRGWEGGGDRNRNRNLIFISISKNMNIIIFSVFVKHEAGAEQDLIWFVLKLFLGNKKYGWRRESEIQMLKVPNRNISGATASKGRRATLKNKSSFYQVGKIKYVPNVCIEECLPVMAASVSQYYHTSVTILILDINHLINVWEGSSGK